VSVPARISNRIFILHRLPNFHATAKLTSSAQLELLLLVPRVRSVFSSSLRDVQLGTPQPPGSGAAGWRAVTRVLRSSAATASADLVNLFFPSDCRLCAAPILDLGASQVCRACLGRVTPLTENLCTRCGDALDLESSRFASALGVTECSFCRLAPPEFARAVAFAPYDSELRELLHLLKFEGRRALAEEVLGRWLATAVLKLRDQAASDLVVIPVPLFAARQRQRGFNQADLLASSALRSLKKLAPEWHLTLAPHALTRIKDTHSLFTLAPHQRRAGLRGAFKVADPAAIAGREVLLLDDIMTTGATARECARTLLRAGAEKVWVATVARAQPDRLASTPGVAIWDANKVQEPQPRHQQNF
jgi:ComF family protein